MSGSRERDAAALFGRALAKLACTAGETLALGAVRSRAWASATFEGERVEIDMPGVGRDAAWLADLPEADLHITGYLVADVVLRRAHGGVTGIEALLIRDR